MGKFIVHVLVQCIMVRHNNVFPRFQNLSSSKWSKKVSYIFCPRRSQDHGTVDVVGCLHEYLEGRHWKQTRRLFSRLPMFMLNAKN